MLQSLSEVEYWGGIAREKYIHFHKNHKELAGMTEELCSMTCYYNKPDVNYYQAWNVKIMSLF